MNKQQLIEIIAEENEITKDMATRTLNTMIRSIMTSVKRRAGRLSRFRNLSPGKEESSCDL